MICIAVQNSNRINAVMNLLDEVNPALEKYGTSFLIEAEKLVYEVNCDMLLVDPELHGGKALSFVREWQKQMPNLNVVFLTDTEKYMAEAFEMFASDYIIWPCSRERLVRSISHLRYPAAPADPENRVQILCFGSFDVLIDGEPVYFRYNKTKELLAVLVDRAGAMTTNAEISALLWEDTRHTSYFKNIRKDLLDTLGHKGCDGIISLGHGKLAIRPDTVECDYFSWLKNPEEYFKYRGEYMSQYSWAEMTNGRLQVSYGYVSKD